MLEIFKGLVGVSDTSKDGVLNHYLDKSKLSIQNYLNYKDYEFHALEFQTQIIDLAMFYYKQKSNTGIIQQSQGSRSQTIERGIPKEIIQSLPLPRVRVVG